MLLFWTQGGDPMEKRRAYGGYIKQLHDEFEKQANNLLRAQGLTMAQFGVLIELFLTEERQLPLKTLEHKLHVAQSTAAGIVVRLEQKGLVESSGDAEDRRVKLVRITPKGEACLQNADRDMDDTEKRLLSPLTPQEQDTFFHLLEKLCVPLS